MINPPYRSGHVQYPCRCRQPRLDGVLRQQLAEPHLADQRRRQSNEFLYVFVVPPKLAAADLLTAPEVRAPRSAHLACSQSQRSATRAKVNADVKASVRPIESDITGIPLLER